VKRRRDRYKPYKDWRDPNMKVLFPAVDPNDPDEKVILCDFESVEITKYYEHKMKSLQNAQHPDWKYDPTYEMRKKR
jgi:hypothetical protein